LHVFLIQYTNIYKKKIFTLICICVFDMIMHIGHFDFYLNWYTAMGVYLILSIANTYMLISFKYGLVISIIFHIGRNMFLAVN
jgi:hypothetical protein